ncbi:hypothetical protein WJX84_000271 [Apatococcus fuscideae]|uniref:Acyl carrier protein n=1 Tax=Apatococcus fuscideae TaxID=2026836 RepID=A0AAW1T6H3_9CHLO
MLSARSTISTRPTVQPKASFASGRPLVASRQARRSMASRMVTRASDKSAVLEDTRGIIAEQLGKELADVLPESKFVDLGADSLDTVEIMMALEEKFSLQLDEQGAEKIETVQQASDLITKQIDSKRA